MGGVYFMLDNIFFFIIGFLANYIINTIIYLIMKYTKWGRHKTFREHMDDLHSGFKK